MAEVSISPSTHSLSNMSSRRAPLTTNANAANYQNRAAAVTTAKPKRSYLSVQREEPYGGQPPTKKQAVETRPLRTPPRQQTADGRVFAARSNASQTTRLNQRLAAAASVKTENVSVKAEKPEKTDEENLENIRQWQKHYRRVFPKFVFYFESVPEDIRQKQAKQVVSLGAREEKFFSNAVTHVVTTRNIPPEHEIPNSADTISASSTGDISQGHHDHPQTINPILLERSSEQDPNMLRHGRFTFEAPMGRRTGAHGHDADPRRQTSRNTDVLYRARELGMKIWALEKLQRMMTTMFQADTGSQVQHGHNTRGKSVQSTFATREADLFQLLRNERINGPSDRDPTVANKEMNIFKGPFIYIHDIDEKTRPIMVREYAKVSRKEDGDWPQFRSVANGKCPFIEEVDYSRRDREKELIRQQRQQERERATASRTRAITEPSRMQPPRGVTGKRTRTEMENDNRPISVATKQSNPFDPPKSVPLKDEQSGPSNAFISRAVPARHLGGEPVASGVQPSNITSAIRSQMISSTAAAPGVKAGTSKEVHGLQRKVLERNSGPASHGLTSSHHMTDISVATREDTSQKIVKKKAEEDFDPSEMEENSRRIEAARKAKAVQKRKLEKRDPKPGYCENCQDKFEDFEEHILSRKHRKFAEKPENWKDLDALINLLARPLRDEY